MPDSGLEARVAALVALITGGVGVPVRRDEPLSGEIPASGVVYVDSGEPGAPDEITLPLTYHYRHAMPVSIFAQSPDARIAICDGIRQAIGAAIEADRTLGGLCDWIEAQMLDVDERAVDNATAIRVERITVTLNYSLTSPLT